MGPGLIFPCTFGQWAVGTHWAVVTTLGNVAGAGQWWAATRDTAVSGAGSRSQLNGVKICPAEDRGGTVRRCTMHGCHILSYRHTVILSLSVVCGVQARQPVLRGRVRLVRAAFQVHNLRIRSQWTGGGETARNRTSVMTGVEWSGHVPAFSTATPGQTGLNIAVSGLRMWPRSVACDLTRAGLGWAGLGWAGQCLSGLTTLHFHPLEEGS